MTRAGIVALGVVGDYSMAADDLARRAHRALQRGTGCHLTPEMVIALHFMEGDGEWWQSFALSRAPKEG